MSGTRSSLRGARNRNHSLLEKKAFTILRSSGGVQPARRWGFFSRDWCDTSVRFCSESIAMDRYRQLVSRKRTVRAGE